MENLSICLQCYATFLDKSNEHQKYRQSLNEPVRQFGDHSSVQFYPACKGPVKACNSILDQIISESGEYTPIFFDDDLHTPEIFVNRMQRLRFIAGLSLRHPVDVLCYDPGAGLGKTVFLWRVSLDRSPVEMMSTAAKMHKKLSSKLPEFHTRQMRKDFIRDYSNVVDIPMHIMRAIYTELTSDATTSQNPAIQARIKQAILTGDPDIAVDLRKLNQGRPDDTYAIFFEQLNKEVNSVTAVDDR